MVVAANSAFRFALEIAGLIAIGYWGYARTDGGARWLLVLVPPLIIASVWAVFRVPGDGGDPVVTVPGIARLGIETLVFALAIAALYFASQPIMTLLLAIAVLTHYAIGWERVRWLLQQ
jgi:hypothetical protein